MGTVLDVMGFYSPDTITEAVINKNILVKGVRDEDSCDMYQIVFSSKTFDLVNIFEWGGYYAGPVRSMIGKGTNTLSSSAESLEARISAGIERTMNTFLTED